MLYVTDVGPQARISTFNIRTDKIWGLFHYHQFSFISTFLILIAINYQLI